MITCDELRKVLEYVPTTGNFYWKVAASNRIIPGMLAGHVNKRGYVNIRYKGKKYFAHRLAWLYVNGSLKAGKVIDHINNHKADNRIDNLRLVNTQANAINLERDDVYGVYVHLGRWAARIRINNKVKFLGTFTTKLEAAAARYKAEEKYGFLDSGVESKAKDFIETTLGLYVEIP